MEKEEIKRKIQKLLDIEKYLIDEKEHLDFDKEYKKELEEDFKNGKINDLKYEKCLAVADYQIRKRNIEVKNLEDLKKSLTEEIDKLRSDK